MSMDNNSNPPPKWAQYLERRIEERMTKERDPFKTNSFMTRMTFWMMLVLSLSALTLILIQTFYSQSLYLLVFLVLGLGTWGGLNYHQRKQKKTVWDFFPQSFKDYVLKKNKFFQISWHIIFLTLITGAFMMTSRYIGFEDVFIPRSAVKMGTPPPRTPEQQKTYEAIEKMLGKKVPLPGAADPSKPSPEPHP